jgi:hypothetical protein
MPNCTDFDVLTSCTIVAHNEEHSAAALGRLGCRPRPILPEEQCMVLFVLLPSSKFVFVYIPVLLWGSFSWVGYLRVGVYGIQLL